jgi:predicted nucleic acid-binding protein
VPDAFVVDTSVFVRWFLEQVGYEHAREVRARFLAGALRLETVDCVRFELGHVLRTRGLLLGRLDGKEYVAATRAIDDLGVAVQITDVDALESASELAWRRNLRFFDAVLVHRAMERGIPLLTSDRKLATAVGTLAPIELLRGVP